MDGYGADGGIGTNENKAGKNLGVVYMVRIILIGSGGHARSVADSILQSKQYEIAGYIERADIEGTGALGIPVLGTDSDLEAIFDAGINTAFVTIGYIGKGNVRERIYNRLKQIGYSIPVIMDPSATLADRVQIGEGTFVGKRAVVNSNAQIGRMCIINTGAIVEHDNEIGDFSHIAVGSVLCGNVKIGKGVLIGANAVVIQGIRIGDGAIVGAGTTVRHDIESGQVYYGK